MALAIIATIELTPGSRDDYLTQLSAHRRRCLEREPGTLAFEILVPHDKENEIMLYELYVDQAAFDTHISGESTAEVRRNTGGMLVSLTGLACTPFS